MPTEHAILHKYAVDLETTSDQTNFAIIVSYVDHMLQL